MGVERQSILIPPLVYQIQWPIELWHFSLKWFHRSFSTPWGLLSKWRGVLPPKLNSRKKISTSVSLWSLQRFYHFWAFPCEFKASKRVSACSPCGKFQITFGYFGPSTLRSLQQQSFNLPLGFVKSKTSPSLRTPCTTLCLASTFSCKDAIVYFLRILRWISEPSRCTPYGPSTALFAEVLRKRTNWNSFSPLSKIQILNIEFYSPHTHIALK
jgi:hypothetical protein